MPKSAVSGPLITVLVPCFNVEKFVEECIDSIVSIRGYLDSGMNLGTGVILSADGYIITNSHVIEGSSRLEVVLQDERVFDALLVGREDSSLLVVGDPVVAIGNPLGEELRGTMTDGIISAINRDVNVDGYTMSLLQTTAALNSGNSGGALINDHGQVVGITNLKMEGYDSTVEGLGFAIPTTTVKEVVDALIAYGQVENRPTIGITGYTVTAEMAAGFDGPQGVAVQTVREGSDAQMQGILPGDIIVEANGETITTMEQLQALKDSLSVGDVLSLRIWRSGHYLERDVRRPLGGAQVRDVCGRMEFAGVIGLTLAYWISCEVTIPHFPGIVKQNFCRKRGNGPCSFKTGWYTPWTPR